MRFQALLLVTTAGLLSVGLSSRAHAAESDPTADWPVHFDPPPPRKVEPPPPPPTTDVVPYDGLPLVLTDAASMVLLLAARGEIRRPFFTFTRGLGTLPATEIVGSALFVLPSSLVHGLHGRPVNALASPLLRAAPAVGLLAGMFVGGGAGMIYGCSLPKHGPADQMLCGGKEGEAGGTAGADIGFFGAAAIAMWFDHTILATRDLTPGAKHRVTVDAVTWAPQLETGPGRFAVGAVARF